MTAWLTFAAAGFGTYLMRALFILVVGARSLPEPVEQALRNVGPAVLAALTTSLLLDDGVAEFVTNVPEVVAVVAAVFVAVRTRNFLWTFLAGMLALWLLQAVV
jgi:branched-subunit amino acid transport protein